MNSSTKRTFSAANPEIEDDAASPENLNDSFQSPDDLVPISFRLKKRVCKQEENEPKFEKLFDFDTDLRLYKETLDELYFLKQGDGRCCLYQCQRLGDAIRAIPKTDKGKALCRDDLESLESYKQKVRLIVMQLDRLMLSKQEGTSNGQFATPVSSASGLSGLTDDLSSSSSSILFRVNNQVYVPDLFFNDLGGTGTRYTVNEVDKALKKQKISEVWLGSIFGMSSQTIGKYRRGQSSGSIQHRTKNTLTEPQKDELAYELMMINRKCVENCYGLDEKKCVKMLKDIVQHKYGDMERGYAWYKNIIKRCNFLYTTARPETTARQNAGVDVRNFISEAMVLETLDIEGKTIDKNGKPKHVPYPYRFLSNQDCTTLILTTATSAKTKIMIDRDMRATYSKNNMSLKTVENDGSLPVYMRVKTAVVTTMAGGLTNVIFLVKSNMKDVGTTDIQYDPEKSMILKQFKEKTVVEPVPDEEIGNHEEPVLDDDDGLTDKDNDEDYTNKDNNEDDEQNEAETDDYHLMRLSDINPNYEEEDNTFNRKEEREMLKLQSKIKEQENLYKKVRTCNIPYPEARTGTKYTLLLAPTGLLEQLMMEIAYTMEGGIMESISKATEVNVNFLQQDNEDANSRKNRAKYMNNEVTSYDENAHFKKIHLIDGDQPQIDMFLKHFKDADWKKKYENFRFVKLPAKCSGVLQPNDLMEGFKLVKKQTPNSNFVPLQNSSLLHKDQVFVIKTFINRYTTLGSKHESLFLKFIKSAGASFDKAFPAKFIQQGYQRGGFTGYTRETVIKKCLNKSLDYDEILRIVDTHSESFKATIREKGLLPDVVMKECGIPGLNLTAHSKPCIRKLNRLADDEINTSGRLNLVFRKEMYDEQDIAEIEKYHPNTYLRNVFIYILKKKALSNTEDVEKSSFLRLSVYIVDIERLIRQRTVILNDPSHDNINQHDANAKKLRQQQKNKDNEEAERTKKQELDRKANQKVTREIAKSKFNSVFICSICSAAFDIDPKKQNLCEKDMSFISKSSCESLEELLEAEHHTLESTVVDSKLHLFFHVSWTNKPRFFCAMCNSNKKPTDELWVNHRRNCETCKTQKACKKPYFLKDFVQVRRQKLAQLASETSTNSQTASQSNANVEN